MKKKGQVWIETVIYTLIGLAIIGILLAVVRPQINSMRDRLAIEQTIESLNEFDGTMDISLGNRRRIDFKISKGSLFIDGVNDNIYWILEDSNKEYSEPGVVVGLGAMEILTTGDKPWTINLSLDYSNLNVTYQGADEVKELESAGTPYGIFVENEGKGSDDRVVMNIEIG